MEIFNAEHTLSLNHQNSFQSLFSIDSENDHNHSLFEQFEEEAEGEQSFFQTEKMFKFPQLVREGNCKNNSQYGLEELLDESPLLRKSISKSKSGQKESRRTSDLSKMNSPEAQRKRKFTSKFSKVKEFSLEVSPVSNTEWKGDKELLKSKSKEELKTEESTRINSRKCSNDTTTANLTELEVPGVFFESPEVTNFSLNKIKKIAESFNFEKKKKKEKKEDPLKLRIKSYKLESETPEKLTSHLEDILTFSRNLNSKAGNSCEKMQNNITQMERMVDFKERSYQRKVEECKYRRFKSLLNF